MPAITPRDFTADLSVSLAREPFHRHVLAAMYDVSPQDIIKTDDAVDRHGADYAVPRPPDPPLLVDIKERFDGAEKRKRRDDPEIPIEDRSVNRVPGPMYRRNVSCDINLYWYYDLPDRAYAVDAVALTDAVRRGVFDGYRPVSTRTQSDRDRRGYYVSRVKFVPISAVAKVAEVRMVEFPNLGNFLMANA